MHVVYDVPKRTPIERSVALRYHGSKFLVLNNLS